MCKSSSQQVDINIYIYPDLKRLFILHRELRHKSCFRVLCIGKNDRQM